MRRDRLAIPSGEVSSNYNFLQVLILDPCCMQPGRSDGVNCRRQPVCVVCTGRCRQGERCPCQRQCLCQCQVQCSRSTAALYPRQAPPGCTPAQPDESPATAGSEHAAHARPDSGGQWPPFRSPDRARRLSREQTPPWQRKQQPRRSPGRQWPAQCLERAAVLPRRRARGAQLAARCK